MGIEVVAGTARGSVVTVARDRRDVKVHRSPGDHLRQRLDLSGCWLGIIEITLEDYEQVAGRVVLGGGVASGPVCPSLIDPPVGSDDEVIGEIGPTKELMPILPDPIQGRP